MMRPRLPAPLLPLLALALAFTSGNLAARPLYDIIGTDHQGQQHAVGRKGPHHSLLLLLCIRLPCTSLACSLL